MNILVTGATGLVGTALVSRLLQSQHNVTALSRYHRAVLPPFSSSLRYIHTLDTYQNLDEFDAVINLAGAPIFAQAWSEQYKRTLVDSRLTLTHQLATLINRGENPPSCFISGSATGYYGDQGEEIITETSSAGLAFTSQLCIDWEKQAFLANTRVCVLRTGIVLSKKGGAFAKMLPIYRWGLGGKLGNGRQYWSWIALPDMVEAIVFLLNNPHAQGAFNLVSPNPVRNEVFNATLGQALKRPHFATVPAFILKCLFGERVSLLLDSQRVYPPKLQHLGFQFRYPEITTTVSNLITQR